PIQAAIPHVTIGAGMESDWGHKSGAGRELRLSIVLRDEGESPARLRALADSAQAAMEGIETGGGWRLVTLVFVRSIFAAQAPGKRSLKLNRASSISAFADSSALARVDREAVSRAMIAFRKALCSVAQACGNSALNWAAVLPASMLESTNRPRQRVKASREALVVSDACMDSSMAIAVAIMFPTPN